jgi:hypothetical protein
MYLDLVLITDGTRLTRISKGIRVDLRTVSPTYILWRTDPLLSSDSVNSGCCYLTHATIEERYFLFGPPRGYTMRRPADLQLELSVVQLSEVT